MTWQYDDWDVGDEVYYDTIEAWEDAENHQDTEYYYGAAKHPGAVTETVYADVGDVAVTYNDDGKVAAGTDQWDRTVTYACRCPCQVVCDGERGICSLSLMNCS